MRQSDYFYLPAASCQHPIKKNTRQISRQNQERKKHFPNRKPKINAQTEMRILDER
jgi:hypothetical protein